MSWPGRWMFLPLFETVERKPILRRPFPGPPNFTPSPPLHFPRGRILRVIYRAQPLIFSSRILPSRYFQLRPAKKMSSIGWLGWLAGWLASSSRTKGSKRMNGRERTRSVAGGGRIRKEREKRWEEEEVRPRGEIRSRGDDYRAYRKLKGCLRRCLASSPRGRFSRQGGTRLMGS